MGPRLLLKAKVKGYMRDGKFVSPYDRDAGKKSGSLHRVPVRPEVFKWLGVEEAPVYADYIRLAEKHPEYFPDAKSAMLHVERVLEHPDISMPATKGDFTMLVRRRSRDMCVVVNLNKKRGAHGYMIRSAYVMDDGQLAKYIAAASGVGEVKIRTLLKKSMSHGAGPLHPGVSRTLGSGISGCMRTGQQKEPSCSSRSLPAPRDAVQPSLTMNIAKKKMIVYRSGSIL